MSNGSAIVLASSIVIASGAIYAYKNDFKFSTVLEKFEDNKDYFCEMVVKLINMGIDVLEKLFKAVMNLLNTIKDKMNKQLRRVI